MGKFTTRNNTTIDYCIANPNLFYELSHFEISDFNPILSDVHCPITVGIKAKLWNEQEQKESGVNQGKYKWKPEKSKQFEENLCKAKISEIENKLTNLLQKNPQTINKKDIQDTIKEINTTFHEARNKTFKKKKFAKKKQEKIKKPWYGCILQKGKIKFS